MNIELMQFQLRAIKALLESMEEPCRDIILKSPTGSGKQLYSPTLWMSICKDTQRLYLYG